VRSIKSHAARARQSRPPPVLDIMTLLGPAPTKAEWEADKAGWRAFVFGNTASGFGAGSRLDRAWRRGYEAAARSDEPAALML
jgi:hypothetical protein